MTPDIYNDTCLIPEIIADGAVRGAFEEMKVTRYELLKEITESVVKRANLHYRENQFFRSLITSNAKGRDLLYSFMQHWTFSILKNRKLI